MGSLSRGGMPPPHVAASVFAIRDLCSGQFSPVNPNIPHPAIEVVVLAEADLQRLAGLKIPGIGIEKVAFGGQFSIDKKSQLFGPTDGGDMVPTGRELPIVCHRFSGFQ